MSWHQPDRLDKVSDNYQGSRGPITEKYSILSKPTVNWPGASTIKHDGFLLKGKRKTFGEILNAGL